MLHQLTDLYLDLVRILVTLQFYRSGFLPYITLYAQTFGLTAGVFLLGWMVRYALVAWKDVRDRGE